MKHVVHYSGGICSFWAAKRVIERHGRENVILLFADTRMEDEDLYRFLQETSGHLGVPISVLTDGQTPWDLFKKKGMLGNSRFPLCSVTLKRDQLDAWRVENCDPAKHRFYLGMDWTETHRMDGVGSKPGMRQIFAPFTVEAPMMDEPIWDKCRMMKELEALGIKLPRLYSMGFPHNNCGGFCVKAGHAQFAHLLKMMPERYAYHEAQETAWRHEVGKDYSILTDRRGDGEKKTLTLKTLRLRIEAGESFDRHDWGGCGCSTS
jgi:hypothetical protein